MHSQKINQLFESLSLLTSSFENGLYNTVVSAKKESVFDEIHQGWSKLATYDQRKKKSMVIRGPRAHHVRVTMEQILYHSS